MGTTLRLIRNQPTTIRALAQVRILSRGLYIFQFRPATLTNFSVSEVNESALRALYVAAHVRSPIRVVLEHRRAYITFGSDEQC